MYIYPLKLKNIVLYCIVLICSTHWILCCRDKTVVRLISWFLVREGIRYVLYLKPNLEINTSSDIYVR